MSTSKTSLIAIGSLIFFLFLAFIRYSTRESRQESQFSESPTREIRAPNDLTLKEFVLRMPEIKSRYLREGLFTCFNGWVKIEKPFSCESYELYFSEEYYPGIRSLKEGYRVCIDKEMQHRILKEFGDEPGKAHLCLAFFPSTGPTLGPFKLVNPSYLEWR